MVPGDIVMMDTRIAADDIVAMTEANMTIKAAAANASHAEEDTFGNDASHAVEDTDTSTEDNVDPLGHYDVLMYNTPVNNSARLIDYGMMHSRNVKHTDEMTVPPYEPAADDVYDVT
mmetsp:Transcript_54689/g.65932  ORF Transcript_54689/g.65932 Transcript_54689/m.65932 type:complete len:117 (-) Transcript_54689:294-644(-)